MNINTITVLVVFSTQQDQDAYLKRSIVIRIQGARKTDYQAIMQSSLYFLETNISLTYAETPTSLGL